MREWNWISTYVTLAGIALILWTLWDVRRSR
jgi:hypothetical protein